MEISTWRGGRGKENYTSQTASVLLHIVTKAHKMKPDLYQACLQQQLLSQSFPFFVTASQQSRLRWRVNKLCTAQHFLCCFIHDFNLSLLILHSLWGLMGPNAAQIGVWHSFMPEE